MLNFCRLSLIQNGYFSKTAFYHVLGNFRGMVERIGKLGTELWENSN